MRCGSFPDSCTRSRPGRLAAVEVEEVERFGAALVQRVGDRAPVRRQGDVPDVPLRLGRQYLDPVRSRIHDQDALELAAFVTDREHPAVGQEAAAGPGDLRL